MTPGTCIAPANGASLRQAQQALSQNAVLLSDNVMIGVAPCTDLEAAEGSGDRAESSRTPFSKHSRSKHFLNDNAVERHADDIIRAPKRRDSPCVRIVRYFFP